MGLPLETLPSWLLVGQIAILETLLLLNLVRFRLWIQRFLLGFAVPEQRQKLFQEIAHGVMRAASERAGSLKGASIRQEGAQLLTTAEGMGDVVGTLAAQLPGTIDIAGFKIPKSVAAQLLLRFAPGILGSATGQSVTGAGGRWSP